MNNTLKLSYPSVNKFNYTNQLYQMALQILLEYTCILCFHKTKNTFKDVGL